MKRNLSIAVIIVSFLLALQAQETIKISRSNSATIDGKIEETEWKNAKSFDLTGGGKVFLKYDGEYLFVGVRGVSKGWSHLYLNQGEKVSILHASAALGMTSYSQNESKLWQPANPFSWDLRDRTITAETIKKMGDYLAKNFWVANNNNMSNSSEIEFQLKPKNTDEQFFLAIVYASDAKNPQYFPVSLNDDTIKEELVYGNTPNDLKFDCNKWAKISLESK
ncbi:MAG TPA: hypothetical protein PKY82_06370 [Pyrinomonadaceae bacterium]|nr:hypothetical protein [Pyrinomonadaceae bacterium]